MDDVPVSDIRNLNINLEESEMSSRNEKTIHYDLKFTAINPKLSNSKIKIFLHFDLEIQNNYTPGYPIVKRGILLENYKKHM